MAVCGVASGRADVGLMGEGWVPPWLKSKKESMSKFSVLRVGLLPIGAYCRADM